MKWVESYWLLDVQNRNDTDLALKLLFSWKLGVGVSVICSDLYVLAIFSYFSDHGVYVCVKLFLVQLPSHGQGLFFLANFTT